MKIFDFILILSSIISSIWLILQIIYYKYSFLYNRFINLYNNKKEQKDDIYYSIIVAIKNENRDVIKQLIDNLKELNWKKYEVIIISDDDEKKFNEIFNGISIPYNFKIIRRDNPKDGKAGALNLGCKEAKGTYLVFLDADARIEKDFLIKLTNKIEKINALRLEIRNHNEGIIPKIYSSMNEFVMNSLFKGRHVLGLPIFPNGSALVIEKSVLENIGFWKSQVTEDLELGIRLFYNNYKVNYIDEVKVSVLAPYTNSDLYRQIERWAYGSGELFLTSLKLIKRGLNGIEAFFYISQWFINSLFFFVLLIFAIFQPILNISYFTYFTSLIIYFICIAIYQNISKVSGNFRIALVTTFASLIGYLKGIFKCKYSWKVTPKFKKTEEEFPEILRVIGYIIIFSSFMNAIYGQWFTAILLLLIGLSII